tara:strand:+ start:447 stop:1067 length:621 start_codon:yes stop_codon:yes gene_type:complete
MPITTYAELKTNIAEFLNRDDVAAISDTFISNAEDDLNLQLRHWRQEKRSTAEIDTQYSAIPADMLEIIRFYTTSGDTRPLELISQAEMLDRKFRNLNTSGQPAYYALTAGELEVYPVPDGTYTSELYYYSRIPALSDSNTTNWVLDYYSSAYLYGSLIHSAPYLKDDARIQVWAALYQSAIDAMNTESEKAKYGGSGRRMKIRSY